MSTTIFSQTQVTKVLNGSSSEDLPQNIIMQNGYTDITKPEHREMIYKYSPFLSQHADSIVRSVMKDIKTQLPFDKIVLQQAIALGWVVGTSAILSFKDKIGTKDIEDRLVISFNDMKDIVYEKRRIMSFKFRLPNTQTDIPFYTQYTETPNSVVYTPLPSKDENMNVLLLRETQTALEIIRLKWMEMIYLRNGGNMSPTVILPNNLPTAAYETIRKQYKLGIESPISILQLPPSFFTNAEGVKMDYDINKILKVWEQGKLTFIDFQIALDHLMQDSPLPQIELTGKAESGAMGGQAPKVDREEAEDVYEEFKVYARPILEDFMLVFGKENKQLIQFGVKPI
jgi:hypothetical protein